MNTAYYYLAVAIVAEVIATSFLKASMVFTRPLPSFVTVVGYAVSFYCLAHALHTIPTGVAYAIWSGVGIVLISIVSWLLFGQHLDAAAMLGIGLIAAGVVVINLFSNTMRH